MGRDDFVYSGVTKESKILEFAPYFRPIYPKKKGYITDIVDVVSKEELIEKAQNDPMIKTWDEIEDVDYIATNNYADIIGKHNYYDVIAASHVIEHTTDIISFLRDCSLLLNDNGVVRLIIPDKRYDFDCFRECTTTRVALDAYLERTNKDKHSIGTVVEGKLRSVFQNSQSSTYIPNSSFFYMSDDLVLKNSNTPSKFRLITEYLDSYNEDNRYVNAHAWVVTPKSFEIMIYELNVLGYIDLTIDSLYSNPRSIEFYVDLRKGEREVDDPKRRFQLYIDRKKETLEEYEDYLTIQKIYDIIIDHKDIYIYGTGKGTKRILRILDYLNTDYKAHIVSDGKRKESFFNGHPVLEFSEVGSNSELIILIGVENEIYRSEIIAEIKKRGMKSFF